MIQVKMQLFINGRYAHKLRVNLGDDDEANLKQITQLFRDTLINLDPNQRYQVDITRRET